MKERPQHQFVSHVTEDKAAVSRLEADLQRQGFSPWVSHSQLASAGGLRWEDVIRQAIREGLAFIACFSSAAAAREKSYMREELNVAIEELRLRPRERGWFFPLRLNSCEIPELPIGPGETLGGLQRIDLFPEWDVGVSRLAASLSRPDQGTANWLAETVRSFAGESQDDQDRWLYVLGQTAQAGHSTVRVDHTNHAVATRLCRLGALEDLGWRRSWHRFGLTERGRLLLAQLIARGSSGA